MRIQPDWLDCSGSKDRRFVNSEYASVPFGRGAWESPSSESIPHNGLAEVAFGALPYS